MLPLLLHRSCLDLKAANVLLTGKAAEEQSDGPAADSGKLLGSCLDTSLPRMTAKISDFGLSLKLDAGETQASHLFQVSGSR